MIAWFLIDGLDCTLTGQPCFAPLNELIQSTTGLKEPQWLTPFAQRSSTDDEVTHAFSHLFHPSSTPVAPADLFRDKGEEPTRIHVFARFSDSSSDHLDGLIQTLQKILRSTVTHIQLHFIFGGHRVSSDVRPPLAIRDLDGLLQFLKENDRSRRIHISSIAGSLYLQRSIVHYFNALTRPEHASKLVPGPLSWVRARVAQNVPSESFLLSVHAETEPFHHRSYSLDLTRDPRFHNYLVAFTSAAHVLNLRAHQPARKTGENHPVLRNEIASVGIFDRSEKKRCFEFFNGSGTQCALYNEDRTFGESQNDALTVLYDDSVFESALGGLRRAWEEKIAHLAQHLKHAVERFPKQTKFVWSGLRPLPLKLQRVMGPFGYVPELRIPIWSDGLDTANWTRNESTHPLPAQEQLHL